MRLSIEMLNVWKSVDLGFWRKGNRRVYLKSVEIWVSGVREGTG